MIEKMSRSYKHTPVYKAKGSRIIIENAANRGILLTTAPGEKKSGVILLRENLTNIRSITEENKIDKK